MGSLVLSEIFYYKVYNEDSDFLAPVSEFVKSLKVKPLQWNTDKAVPGTSEQPLYSIWKILSY